MGRKKKQDPLQDPTPDETQPDQIATDVALDDVQVLSPMSPESAKDFKKTLTDLEKQFGVGAIASAEDILYVEKVSTRNLLLDILTEGGLPKGSITLFFGEESSGKTLQTLVLASVFTSQKIPVLYICAEGDVDKTWIQKLGNDLKYFMIARPDDLEKAIDLADVAVRSRTFGLVIFDSVTAGIPRESVDKKSEQDQYALQARRNTKLVQKITSGLQPADLTNPNDYNNTVVVLIAHVREKVGVVYGSPETIPGGHALRHHSAYIIKYKKGAKLTDGDKIIGREAKITIDKAKFSTPLVSGVTEFFFYPPRFNNAKVLLTYATQYGIIERAGAYYSYGDLKAQGQKELLKLLKEKGELQNIKGKLIQKFSTT